MAKNKKIVQISTINGIEEQNKQIINEFVSDKQNKQFAVETASNIFKQFEDWFIIPQLVDIFDVEIKEASKQIEMLMLFNLCIGKVENSVPYFKIDLDRKAQRSLLLEEISTYEGKVLFLKEKLAKLN